MRKNIIEWLKIVRLIGKNFLGKVRASEFIDYVEDVLVNKKEKKNLYNRIINFIKSFEKRKKVKTNF